MTDRVPEQPAARSGEVIASTGRWNEAALKRLHRLSRLELKWTAGTLGRSASIDSVVIGRLNRHGKGQPWTIKIVGFELWHEPTRIIKYWHYAPVWAMPTLAAAQREFERVLRTIPALDAKC